MPLGSTWMHFLRDCLFALLLALMLALSVSAGEAADLGEALAHFAADDFSETANGVAKIAASGDARAATILEALQSGRLLFSAAGKKVFYKDGSDQLIDAATGQAAAGAAPSDLEA